MNSKIYNQNCPFICGTAMIIDYLVFLPHCGFPVETFRFQTGW